MRKFLAVTVVGASLALSVSAALADSTFLPNTPDNNVPVVMQPNTPDQGTVAGGNDQDQGPYFQWHFDNMGH